MNTHHSPAPAAVAPPAEILALGEVMLRFSPPGNGRLEFATSLEVDVGGGEYNVAYALARLGWRTGFVTRLPDHPMSRLVINHARAAGMDARHMHLVPYDGVGRSERLGLYFAEAGVGARGGMALFDRGHSAASRMKVTDIDWPKALGGGCRWFHASGIFPVLGPNCADVLELALRTAAKEKVVTSYDLNYRAALCDPATAAAVNRRLVALTDVLIGSPEGLVWLLADDPPPAGLSLSALVDAVHVRFPNLKTIAGTQRTVHSGTRHDLGGFWWQAGHWWQDPGFSNFEIVDRIGTGDAFSAGVVHGLLHGWESAKSLRFALAYAVLVHTTRGDTAQFTAAEIEHVAAGGNAAIQR